MFSPSSSSCDAFIVDGADDFLVRYSPSRCSRRRFNMQNESARALTHAFTRLSDHQQNGTSENESKKKSIMAKTSQMPSADRMEDFRNNKFGIRETRDFPYTSQLCHDRNDDEPWEFASKFLFFFGIYFSPCRTLHCQPDCSQSHCRLCTLYAIAFTHSIDRMSLRHSVRSSNESQTKRENGNEIKNNEKRFHRAAWSAHMCWRRRRRRRPSKLAIVHARHGNNCIKCRRPTQWTQREHVNEMSSRRHQQKGHWCVHQINETKTKSK